MIESTVHVRRLCHRRAGIWVKTDCIELGSSVGPLFPPLAGGLCWIDSRFLLALLSVAPMGPFEAKMMFFCQVSDCFPCAGRVWKLKV